MVIYKPFKEGEYIMKKITNKSDFDELIEKIQKSVTWYEKANFDNKVYNIALDNGEKLNVCFNHTTIAHLLGIRTEYLKATGLFPKDSYEILKILRDDPYRFYNMVNRGHLTYDSFISDYADDKIKYFSNACGINLYDIEFVCKYSKEFSYITGYPQLEGDYYIGYKTNDGVLIVGFKYDGENYVPITNRPIDYKDEEAMKFLKHLLENQSITMPSMSRIYFNETNTYSNMIFIDDQRKASRIRKLKKYAEQYNSTVDVSDGYIYIIEKLFKQYNSKNVLFPALKIIFEKVSKRIKIEVSELQLEFGKLPPDILSLIDSYNDSLDVDISKALDEHTKSVISERDRLSNENQKHIEELTSLKEELLNAKALIEQLQSDNAQYRERESSIKRILSM